MSTSNQRRLTRLSRKFVRIKGYKMLVSVYRYNPETDREPYMQDVEVSLPEGKDLMVLDAQFDQGEGSIIVLSSLMPKVFADQMA